ncbi:hypothetical protein BDV36DRAFT_248226 [Aspergillus pseudocaelatus]|uniref:Uncharacterized protein n=1 Tax=Aspergillus pseudocaelatus TaxID=1825620 RepID=A0ABQ6WVK4_9EURO|nr:hypothetical protein BDV36DRAFT_248226 [Aspergillus pseudocaelatus]
MPAKLKCNHGHVCFLLPDEEKNVSILLLMYIYLLYLLKNMLKFSFPSTCSPF